MVTRSGTISYCSTPGPKDAAHFYGSAGGADSAGPVRNDNTATPTVRHHQGSAGGGAYSAVTPTRSSGSERRDSIGQWQQTGSIDSSSRGQAASNVGDRTPSQGGEGLEVGDSVIGRWFDDRRWYVATIKSVSRNNRYNTRFTC